MKLIYIKDQDKYLDIESKFFPNELYTDDDLDFFLKLESEYNKSLTKPSLTQLIEMFPTAKLAAKRGLTQKIKNAKAEIESLIRIKEVWIRNYVDKIEDMSDQQEVRNALEAETNSKIEEVNRNVAIYKFQIEMLKREAVKDKAIKVLRSKSKSQDQKQVAIQQMKRYREEKKSRIDADTIARAKDNKIKDFIKVRGDGKAECLYHAERPGHRYKMQVYGNKFKCFSCGESGSVVDIIMKLYNISFVEAVKKLTTG